MLVPHSDLVPESPHSMAEPNAVDALPVDDRPSARFTWKIENFSKLKTKKLYSEVFYVGGYKWRVLMFPKGNNVDHFSMYLDVADSSTLPNGWSRCFQFSLAVVNQIHAKFTVREDAQHQFHAQESDWGFTSLIPLSELYDPAIGYLLNDTCIVEADVALLRAVDYWLHDSKKENVICNVDERDIAEPLRKRLKKEQEEKEQKKKEKEEAHLYTIVKVIHDGDLLEQIGRDTYFDLVDHDKVRSFRIRKLTPFNLFKEKVAEALGIPVQFQRFWLWAKRVNHTYRPNRPLTPAEEAQFVGQIRENNAELKLFLEVEIGQDLQPVPPPVKLKEEILLFFKLYDPLKEKLRYVGRLFVKSTGRPADILAKLNDFAGFAPDEEIDLFEEIKFDPNVMCDPIDKKLTFRGSQLEDGDIVCFQKPLHDENCEQCTHPDLPAFLEYVHNRQVVRFRSLEKPKEDEFSLKLSKLHNYDDVVDRVAIHLCLDDPSKIRLISHNCYSQQPKPQPIKYRGVEHLSDMLVHYNQTSDILYYEVLDIPLPELQGLKTLKVAFHHATKDEVVIHTIRFAKQSTVGDVISDLKTKVELSHPNAEVRLLEVLYHKIYKIFPLGEKIENIKDQYWTLRAEEIPEEEKEIGPQDRLIHVYHFMKDTAQNQVQNFGEPFFLVIHEGETLAEVKVRVQKKLQVPDEEFSKWNFAFLSLGPPEYLLDTDIVSTRFQRRDVYGAWEQYLGLEHSDNSPERSHSANQVHELALGNGAHVIEASADNKDHNTELPLGHGAEAIEASAQVVADETDNMNSKVEPTGTVSFERKGIACICTSSGLKIINVEDGPPSVEDPESWRGFPVGKDHASLLHNAEVEHPDFFNDVKYSSARRVIQSLNLFASNLANLASDKHGNLSRDDLQVMWDELSDLERDGFRIRWAIESVDCVFTLCFQLPLQQEITQLTAESTHLRGEIEHLQLKTASLKEKIEHAEKELAAAEKDMGEAEVRLKEIASELETRGRLLAEFNSIMH